MFAHLIGKLAVYLHYKSKLDIYALCSIHEPELYARGQNKAKIPSSVRWAVWRRDSFTCVYCLSYGDRLTLDHVVPEKHGGLGTEENLFTACVSCNRKKSESSYEDFITSPYLTKKRLQNERSRRKVFNQSQELNGGPPKTI